MENEEEKLTEFPAVEEEVPEGFKAASTFELVKALYKNDMGQPFEMTPGQNEIFDCIFKKQSPDGKRRIHVMTFTQYGKSDVVSMAVLTRVATFGDKFAIVAPTQPKARIIIGYLIKHIFDNEYTLSRFKTKEGESMETIRRERSKNRITFDCGNNNIGEIFILSAESRLKQSEDMGNSLMGFGSPNLIEDEAALISDESDAKAMRMVGGFSAFQTDFVVKIGNPFTRGHFLQAYQDANYHKINIDYPRGIKEGRLSEKFIEEMEKKPYFGVLYGNQFPGADDIDSRGWTQMISEQDIEDAMAPEDIKHLGEKRIGNDVARGGSNFTVWALRSMNYCEVLAKTHMDNLTETAAQTLFFLKENNVKPESTFIDDVGVGGGAVDPLHYEQKNVRGVNVGLPAMEQNRFANIRAEAYWRFREWIKRGGKLCRCHKEDWFQLTQIKYKPDSKGRLRVMSKDDMRAQGIDSPDVADSGMLTFVRKEHGDMEERRQKREHKRRKQGKKAYSFTMGGY